MEKEVHFEDRSPNLSSTPFHTSYTVETDSDTSDSTSPGSDMWDSIDSCSDRSHQYSPCAYIATLKGPSQHGTYHLPAPTLVDLGDKPEHLHLLIDECDLSIVVARAHSDPQVHSLHDQSSQVGVIVDSYVQKLVEVSLSVVKIDGSVE